MIKAKYMKDLLVNKLFTISPYCIYPPVTGGPKRIFYLNRGLVRSGWNVFQFSGSTKRDGALSTLLPKEIEIHPKYTEYKNFNPLMYYFNKMLTLTGCPLMGFSLFPRLLFNPKVLKQKIKSHKYIMLEHPYLYKQIKRRINDQQFLILNAHNIEYKIYDEKSRGNLVKSWMSKRLFNIEKEAFLRANISFVCSEEDKKIAIDLYGANPERVIVAPNGVDVPEFHIISDEERNSAKQVIGQKGNTIALFIGSNWQPNVEAVDEIVKMAKVSKNLHYLVVGGVGQHFKNHQADNITFTGFVDDINLYIAASDVAINPMVSGSGTNIKMFEYLAAGLPVVSTAFGSRGLTGNDNGAVISSSLADFPRSISVIVNNVEELLEKRQHARKMVVENYDWTMIASKMSDVILEQGKLL
jgi:glycosyltransferase involved in cell wall biosynthesis